MDAIIQIYKPIAETSKQPKDIKLLEKPKACKPQRVVIMAAGGGHRWHNYQNTPKQLLKIDGEPILKRTIRQLRERGITDIYVSVREIGQYGELDAHQHVEDPNEFAIDRVWGARQLSPCIFLYGDCYYTNATMDLILADQHDYRFFGKSAGDKIKRNREIYAIKANQFVIDKAGELREMVKVGIVRRSLGGHLLIHCLGISHNEKLKEHLANADQIKPIFTEISDITTDFDKPSDYVRWMLLNGKKAQKPNPGINKFHNPMKYRPTRPTPRAVRNYYSFDRMAFDLKHSLLPKLPVDIDLVVGIPRDGIMIAYLISIYRNIPFVDLNSFCAGITPRPGIKHREAEEFNKEPHNILLVDDICATGKAMDDAVTEINQTQRDYKLYTCALYVSNPQEKVSKGLIDIWGCELIGPRHYEWTHCDAFHLPNTMMDIDGILCPDCPPEKDNDSQEYINWLINVPLKLRPKNIGCLITWRREKYRKLTEEWLAKHGITYERLIMADREKWPGPAEFKAHHYGTCIFRFFIDSSSKQALRINQITHKPTLGFDTNEAYGLGE
jgi:hypothetical protein